MQIIIRLDDPKPCVVFRSECMTTEAVVYLNTRPVQAVYTDLKHQSQAPFTTFAPDLAIKMAVVLCNGHINGETYTSLYNLVNSNMPPHMRYYDMSPGAGAEAP